MVFVKGDSLTLDDFSQVVNDWVMRKKRVGMGCWIK